MFICLLSTICCSQNTEFKDLWIFFAIELFISLFVFGNLMLYLFWFTSSLLPVSSRTSARKSRGGNQLTLLQLPVCLPTPIWEGFPHKLLEPQMQKITALHQHLNFQNQEMKKQVAQSFQTNKQVLVLKTVVVKMSCSPNSPFQTKQYLQMPMQETPGCENLYMW